jgi:hypothetical protein
MKRGGGIFNRLRGLKNTMKNKMRLSNNTKNKMRSMRNTLRNKYRNVRNTVKNKLGMNNMGPVREGSALYKVTKNQFNANKSGIGKLVKALQEVRDKIYREMKEKHAKFFGEKPQSLKEMLKEIYSISFKERMAMGKDYKDLMHAKTTLDVSKEDTEKARVALENYMKMIGKTKDSVIRRVMQKVASYSKQLRDAMDLVGVRGESIGKLFDHIEDGTLTNGKALVLLAAIEKHKDLLQSDSAEEVKKNFANNIPKPPVEGNGNGNQEGGADEFAKANITLVLLAIAASTAVPSYGVGTLVCLGLIVAMWAND